MSQTIANCQMRLSILSLSLFSGTHLEFLKDIDLNLKQKCKFDAYIKEERFSRNPCFVNISLKISFWAHIELTNITMRRLYISNTGSK